MNIERRKKYSGGGRTAVKTDKKIHLNLDLISLNLMCQYIMSDNRNIRRGHLINLRNVIEMLDMSDFENDIERTKRLDFIKRGLEGRLIFNIRNSDMLIKHINGGLTDDSIIDINTFAPMSNDEMNWINTMVSESLKHGYIYNYCDSFIDICTRVKTAEFGTKGEAVREFESLINEIQNKFRRARVESVSEMMFSLRSGVFEEAIKDFHEQLTNPSCKLRCGMQGLNEMTGGGFESGRVYMLFGLPGEGKSATLLNLAYQIKKYNRNFTPKDPTKIPCIVLLTMENTVRETVERLFNIACTPDNIINFDIDQVIQLLREEGELYLNDRSPIDIIIKYMPDRSVDTGYLYTLTEDLEDEGYEVVCLIQDYIKRIRSVDRIQDPRLELGAVVNEFKNFAAIKDIPVISASQLNRDATKHIDEGRKTNKADLLRLIGRSNIGESMLILENVDCSFLIAPEYDQNGNKFMGIQRVKIRYKTESKREHMYHPFCPDNFIKFVEDADAPIPVYRNSMRMDDNGDIQINIHTSPYHINAIKDLDTDMTFRRDDEHNSFESRQLTELPMVANSKLIVPAFFMEEPLKVPAYFN